MDLKARRKERFPSVVIRRRGHFQYTYSRRSKQIHGYDYRRKIGRRWRRIHVSAYVQYSYVLIRRQKLPSKRKRAAKKYPPSLPPPPVSPSKWLTRQAWLEDLGRQYEDLDLTRSDLPHTSMKWFHVPSLFLWRYRRYPPYGKEATYSQVSLYLMIWDQRDELHKIFVQTYQTVRNVYDAMGVRNLFENIQAHIKVKFAEQTKKLEDDYNEEFKEDITGGSYIDVKALVGWTVYPSLEYHEAWEKRREARERRQAKLERPRMLRREARRYKRTGVRRD